MTDWRARRAERLQRKALEELDLEVGQRVWYWNQHQDVPAQWVTARVAGAGAKDGYPTVDVEIEDAEGVLPEVYRGFRKWGYGWQVKPWSEEKPAPVDLEETWP